MPPSDNIMVIEPTVIDRRTAPEDFYVRLKVAAYARVSTDQEEQQTSYETQVRYYTDYIQAHPGWDFVEVYADEGITGTSTSKREGFRRMIDDAFAGKIDLILTKSISRFARNTLDTLKTVRELKDIGVEVMFEKEHLHSFDPKCEMMLTVLSSLAQEESRSISENIRWAHQKNMERGKVYIPYQTFLGYRKGADGKPEIIESEAKVVRKIYDMYIGGQTIQKIANTLTAQGIPTPGGKKQWSVSTIRSILSNEKYKGDALLQKTFSYDYLSRTRKKNDGSVRQYYVKHSHPAIIDPELFDLVQDKLHNNTSIRHRINNASPFATKIICSDCGSYYGRKTLRRRHHLKEIVWYCNQRYERGKTCTTPIIKEDDLKIAFVEALEKVLSGNSVKAANQKSHSLSVLQENVKKATSVAKEAKEKLEKYKIEHRDDNTEESRREYAEKVQKMLDKRKAIELAKNDVIHFKAQEMKNKLFREKTAGLSETEIEFTDDLFTETVENITVSPLRGDKYTLRFLFTNGETAKIKRER